MITKYKDRKGKWIVIFAMDDDHLLNSHRYFSLKRVEMEEREADGKEILHMSLLINSLWQEIERRELLKY